MDTKPEKDEQTASLREAFRRLAGEDMEIDAYELMEILNTSLKKGKPTFPHSIVADSVYYFFILLSYFYNKLQAAQRP